MKEKGILIGTIFTMQQAPIIRETMGQMGACFYEGDEIMESVRKLVLMLPFLDNYYKL